MYVCVLCGLDPDHAGPNLLTYDDPEDITDLAQEMAPEVTAILGESHSTEDIQAILEDALILPDMWLVEYTGRIQEGASSKDNFYDTGVVIGPQTLTRVENYSYDYRRWDTVVMTSEDGKSEERIQAETRVGGGQGAPFFCWERPYLYFRDWLRHSSKPISLLDNAGFAERLFRVVNSNHGDACVHRDSSFGLLPCISYGGIEKMEDYGDETVLHSVRDGVKNTAAAIAAAHGARFWRLDDISWPTPPTSTTRPRVQINPGTSSVLHTSPPEVLIQILALLPLSDLLSLLLLSHGVASLVSPLLDEALWHHVHLGNLYWMLPVAGVKGEVQRASRAAMKWCNSPRSKSAATSQARKTTSVLESKDFPFSAFLPACFAADSMRNRERLWKISQQFKVLWETTVI
ncbi:hypothetical protein C8F01DRAFT_1254532 [Mycena amicta]|nr:hypothetical protein C8F01DRAFT_1254532 [Mycena amicta]